MQQVELVACGDSHTLALTVDGSVFGWGCYKDKEGRKWFDAQRDNPATFTAKSIKRQQNEPMRIQSLPAGAVTQLSCGATFNACLLRDGQARLWGLGETGELARKVKGWDATPPESTMRNGEGDYLFDQILDQHLTPGYEFCGATEDKPENATSGCGTEAQRRRETRRGPPCVCGLATAACRAPATLPGTTTMSIIYSKITYFFIIFIDNDCCPIINI